MDIMSPFQGLYESYTLKSQGFTLCWCAPPFQGYMRNAILATRKISK
jgi:hypothetical protein